MYALQFISNEYILVNIKIIHKIKDDDDSECWVSLYYFRDFAR